MNANDFLEMAIEAIGQRAEERDIERERSAARAADIFSTLAGKEMSEKEAWQFMCCLKLVRSATGKFKADDYVDLAGYAALAGECGKQEGNERYIDSLNTGWTTSLGAKYE